MKTKIIAISLILAAVVTVSCGESGFEPAADSPSEIPAFVSEYLTEPAVAVPSGPVVSEFPVITESGFPDEWTFVTENDVSAIMAEFSNELIALTIPEPGRKMNLLDVGASLPAKRVQNELTYDEFIEFIDLVEKSPIQSIEFYRCSREVYDAETDHTVDYFAWKRILIPEDGSMRWWIDPAAFLYNTYIVEDYTGGDEIGGTEFYKPFRVDYNNDGQEDIVIMRQPSWIDHYTFSVYAMENGKYKFERLITCGGGPNIAMTFGFFVYNGNTFYINSGRINPTGSGDVWRLYDDHRDGFLIVNYLPDGYTEEANIRPGFVLYRRSPQEEDSTWQ